MGLFLSIFFGFAPMFLFAMILFWIDRYEKEPLILLGVVFLWGTIIAAGGSFLINTLLGMGVYVFTGSEAFTDIATGSLFAPIVEETLKGLAVLVVYLVYRKEFDSVLDGIVYAGIAALGFAATENAYYIFNYGFLENGYAGLFVLFFIRVVLVGLQHPFYTAFIGIGLAIARLNHNWIMKIGAPLVGFMLAVTTHSFHNTMATIIGGTGGLILGTVIDWTGWFFMLAIIVWAATRENRWITEQLMEEVSLGTMTFEQYRTAGSALMQSRARMRSLSSASFTSTHRFYLLCAELAFKKHQLSRLGEEYGNTRIIVQLREQLSSLSFRAAS